MGLLISAYIVTKDDYGYLQISEYEDYEECKYVGDDEFIRCLRWSMTTENQDPYLDYPIYLRPDNIQSSIEKVNLNPLIPDCNKLIFVKLLEDMDNNKDLYIYLNV